MPGLLDDTVIVFHGPVARQNFHQLRLTGSSYWFFGIGAPEEIRTPDPQIRSLVLYPAELRAHLPVIPQRQRDWRERGSPKVRRLELPT